MSLLSQTKKNPLMDENKMNSVNGVILEFFNPQMSSTLTRNSLLYCRRLFGDKITDTKY